jgi:hypothetical protein
VPIPRNDRQQLPWPTDHILSEGDRRYHGTVTPDEPKNLAEFIPEQWAYKADWHAARSSVAHSLNRKALPEIEAMIGRGRLARYTGGPEPTGELLCW